MCCWMIRCSSRRSQRISMPASAASLSDIAGLAFRMAPGAFAATPWDVLLASAGSGLLTRVVLQPVTSWSGASFSSVMPLGYEGGVWWLRARMASGMDGAGLSLDTITDRLGRGSVPFDVEQVNGTGGFRPLARLSLDEVIPTDDPASGVSFDPTLHCPPGVKLLPGWLTDVRRLAYRRSRRRRRAEEHRCAFKLAVARRNQMRCVGALRAALLSPRF
jgi:hypothetical protein